MSRSVLVCFAVKEEAAPFLRQLPAGIEVLVTGMGAAAAERATRPRLTERKWDFVLTCGFAGGLNPDLRPETVIFESEANFPLHQALRNAGAAPARFHCAGRVAVTTAEKSQLRAATGADAVEMESGVIVRLCRERGVPCATVRVVSDPAEEPLPLDFNALMRSDGTLHLGKLLGAVLRRPQKIPALMALGQRTKSAAQRLAAVLHATLAASGAGGVTR